MRLYADLMPTFTICSCTSYYLY